jgi:predicted transcriptional regulator
VWASLSTADRKAQRKSVAEKLYKQNFTMEQIATQLGVSQATISGDLEGLSTPDKPPRPKGGRPKGKAPRSERLPKAIEREERVAVLKDAGLTVAEIAEEVGLGERAVNQALEHVDIKREAVANIDPTTLSMTAQQKLDAAMRQQAHQQAAQFEQRVRDEIKKRIDEIVLPHWKEQIEQAQTLYERRKGLMDKETFNIIRRALHPDSRNSISDKKLGEAFDKFMQLEKFLLDEKNSPTDFGELPSTLAEWDKMRVKRKAAGRPNGKRTSVQAV